MKPIPSSSPVAAPKTAAFPRRLVAGNLGPGLPGAMALVSRENQQACLSCPQSLEAARRVLDQAEVRIKASAWEDLSSLHNWRCPYLVRIF